MGGQDVKSSEVGQGVSEAIPTTKPYSRLAIPDVAAYKAGSGHVRRIKGRTHCRRLLYHQPYRSEWTIKVCEIRPPPIPVPIIIGVRLSC